MKLHTPIANAYWVRPGNLLAGEYPAFVGVDEAPERLNALLDAGITLFLDLTMDQEYGLPPYAPLLNELAEKRGLSVQHVRMPIRDMRTPTFEFMREIQHALQVALDRGDNVYVHCFGGIGRTGTVIGCHLVGKGQSGEQAIAEIATLRRGIPSADRTSPETSAQRKMVIDWEKEAQS